MPLGPTQKGTLDAKGGKAPCGTSLTPTPTGAASETAPCGR
nr:MAG TPA: hypothetical protein [Caudoviricetes sp.]